MPRACRPARSTPSRPSVVSAATNLAATIRREWSSRIAKQIAFTGRPVGPTQTGPCSASETQELVGAVGRKAPDHPGRTGRDLPAHADPGEVTLDRPGRRRAGPVDAGEDPRDLRARPGRLLAPQRDGLLQQHGGGPRHALALDRLERVKAAGPICAHPPVHGRARQLASLPAGMLVYPAGELTHDHAALTACQSLVDRVADHAIAPQRLGLTPVMHSGLLTSGWQVRAPPSRPPTASVRARPCWPTTTRRSLRTKTTTRTRRPTSRGAVAPPCAPTRSRPAATRGPPPAAASAPSAPPAATPSARTALATRRPARAAAAAIRAPSSPAPPAAPRSADTHGPPRPSQAPSRSPTRGPSAPPPRTPAATHATPRTAGSDSAAPRTPAPALPIAPTADRRPTPPAARRSQGSAHRPDPDPRPGAASPRPDVPRRPRPATAQAKRPPGSWQIERGLLICQEPGGLFPFRRTSSRPSARSPTPPAPPPAPARPRPRAASRARPHPRPRPRPREKLCKTLRVSHSNSNYYDILNLNGVDQALHRQTTWRSTGASPPAQYDMRSNRGVAGPSTTGSL